MRTLQRIKMKIINAKFRIYVIMYFVSKCSSRIETSNCTLH